MYRLSKQAEKLLQEILNNRDTDGNCDIAYWRTRFEGLSISEDMILRSLFKDLIEEELVVVTWADDVPSNIFLLSDGLMYFEEEHDSPSSATQNIYNTNFYGDANGVQIQQGTVQSSQYQEIQCLDQGKIDELVQMLQRYDSVLDGEFGVENAGKIREWIKDLDTDSNEKKKKVLSCIKDLCVNAGGGLISAGLIQLISVIMR